MVERNFVNVLIVLYYVVTLFVCKKHFLWRNWMSWVRARAAYRFSIFGLSLRKVARTWKTWKIFCLRLTVAHVVLGIVSSLKESFGFIERADVVAEIFFHYSEFNGDVNDLMIGDDVEFQLVNRSVSSFNLQHSLGGSLFFLIFFIVWVGCFSDMDWESFSHKQTYEINRSRFSLVLLDWFYCILRRHHSTVESFFNLRIVFWHNR